MVLNTSHMFRNCAIPNKQSDPKWLPTVIHLVVYHHRYRMQIENDIWKKSNVMSHVFPKCWWIRSKVKKITIDKTKNSLQTRQFPILSPKQTPLTFIDVPMTGPPLAITRENAWLELLGEDFSTWHHHHSDPGQSDVTGQICLEL